MKTKSRIDWSEWAAEGEFLIFVAMLVFAATFKMTFVYVFVVPLIVLTFLVLTIHCVRWWRAAIRVLSRLVAKELA